MPTVVTTSTVNTDYCLFYVYYTLGTVTNTLQRFLNLILTQLSEQGIVSIFQVRNPKFKKFMLLAPKSQIGRDSCM